MLGGQNTMPPYRCQPGFGSLPERTPYEAATEANLARAAQGLNAAHTAALTRCFQDKMTQTVTPAEIAAMNDHDPAVMSKLVIAITQTARDCKAEVAP